MEEIPLYIHFFGQAILLHITVQQFFGKSSFVTAFVTCRRNCKQIRIPMDCLGTDHLILIDGSWSGDKTFSGEDLFFRDLRPLTSFYLRFYKVCNNINPGSGYFV